MPAPDSSMKDETWKFFQRKKVKIASEIKQPFPFLHILRDKEIILEKDFKEWLKKTENSQNCPEAFKKVIYNVLDSIKSESALSEIFCEEILDAYPTLKPIYQELKNVSQSAGTSSASKRKSDEVHNLEKNNLEISTRKKRMTVAARTKRIKKKYCQRQLISRRKMTGLPKERKEQKKKNLILNFKDFILPVNCGKAHGHLYEEKIAAGILKKSIKTSDGKWLTLNEFEAEGGRAHWKNWKRSIRCHHNTLEKLIKACYLKDPSRSRCRKNKPENHLCSVCSSGENLRCCDFCSKSFHDSCHVPDIPNKKRDEWKCTFCEWSENYSKNHSLRKEEKALMLLMRPKQILMCQYLLLKIWCQTGCIVAEDGNMSTELKEVKKKLHQKQYEKVEDFKRDMCQIFTNFQERNKGKKIAKN